MPRFLARSRWSSDCNSLASPSPFPSHPHPPQHTHKHTGRQRGCKSLLIPLCLFCLPDSCERDCIESCVSVASEEKVMHRDSQAGKMNSRTFYFFLFFSIFLTILSVGPEKKVGGGFCSPVSHWQQEIPFPFPSSLGIISFSPSHILQSLTLTFSTRDWYFFFFLSHSTVCFAQFSQLTSLPLFMQKGKGKIVRRRASGGHLLRLVSSCVYVCNVSECVCMHEFAVLVNVFLLNAWGFAFFRILLLASRSLSLKA